MSSKVTTAIVLFKKRKKKSGKYPAKLRLTYSRKQFYYTIDTKDRVYEFTEEEFEKIQGSKPRGVFKEIQIEFSLIEEKAQKIIQKMEYFTFDQFKTYYSQSGTDLRNIFYYLNRRIERYNATGYGSKTAITVKKNLQKCFKKKEFMDFRDFSLKRVQDFERYLREDKGLRTTTIGSYTAMIRTVFYEAITENAISPEILPFGRGKYQIPTSVTMKRAMDIKDIEKIYKYKPEPFSHEHEAHDLWLFTYLCNGINMTDLCSLKYKDIKKDFIYFVRKKTERKTLVERPITIPLTEDIWAIIHRRGTKDKSPENYIFPYILDKDSQKSKNYKIAWRVRKTNMHMQKIANKLNIDHHITTYTARHSFATVLKRCGVPISFISESLGHKDVKITETYLGSFENNKKRDIAKYLTNFD